MPRPTKEVYREAQVTRLAVVVDVLCIFLISETEHAGMHAGQHTLPALHLNHTHDNKTQNTHGGILHVRLIGPRSTERYTAAEGLTAATAGINMSSE